ncbi:MAG: hypothetical protein IJF30_00805 [Clostridia bacterium]|nr:hypothetical protein [Clostridia bacterium]MBQ9997527.1 hypothetical protein [Clostridia bacterium]
MTIKDAIDKACLIGDIDKEEYTYGQFVSLADQAQKIIGNLCVSIINVISVKNDKEDTVKYVLPDDFKELYRIKRRLSSVPVIYELIGKELYINGAGEFDIFYVKIPEDIDATTPEEYVFEVDKSTHFAIPYYIAYQICKSYDSLAAQSALTEWNKYVALCKRKNTSVRKNIINHY